MDSARGPRQRPLQPLRRPQLSSACFSHEAHPLLQSLTGLPAPVLSALQAASLSALVNKQAAPPGLVGCAPSCCPRSANTLRCTCTWRSSPWGTRTPSQTRFEQWKFPNKRMGACVPASPSVPEPSDGLTHCTSHFAQKSPALSEYPQGKVSRVPVGPLGWPQATTH